MGSSSRLCFQTLKQPEGNLSMYAGRRESSLDQTTTYMMMGFVAISCTELTKQITYIQKVEGSGRDASPQFT
jgi:hypothetical protein